MANSFDRIYAVVKKIPRGTVASYGQVALLAGNPRWARVVGYALHANPDPEGIPCYRVVTKDGRTSPAFAFGGADIQRALLEAVTPVNVSRYSFSPDFISSAAAGIFVSGFAESSSLIFTSLSATVFTEIF